MTENKPHFEVFKDDGGEYRWRLRALNGEIVATGEAYTTEADARRAVADAANVSALAIAHPVELRADGS